MAPKGKSQHRANFGCNHGKAVLCSNIHQRERNGRYKEYCKRTYESYGV
jgi:hypothetical protein